MKLNKSFGEGKKFRIVIKRDFGPGPGYWIGGKFIKTGFVATRAGCNIMPGAVWFRSVKQAMNAIEVYLSVDTVQEFWEGLRKT